MTSFRNLLRNSAAIALALASSPATSQTISYIDLHPDGAASSTAYDVSGNQQVGQVMDSDFPRTTHYAARWEGSAASYLRVHTPPPGGNAIALATQDGLHGGWVGGDYAYLWDEANGVDINLHPDGFGTSYLIAIGGDQQVGVGGGNGIVSKALLWRGSAASAVNLTPPPWPFARADGTDGYQQVGTVIGGFGRGAAGPHAALWEGTAASFVDLHPEGYRSSRAFCVSEGWQGGAVFNPPGIQAAMWSGTPESVIILHPAGAEHSEIWGMDGAWQIGMTEIGETSFAALWNDSAESHRNLHSVLAGDGYTESQAHGIEVVGLEVRIVGWARAADGNRHAILWTVQLPDTTPPVIDDFVVDPPALWPPNRKLRPIDLQITASDDSGAFGWAVVEVTCNEDCDESDIRNSGQDLALRAKRSGRSKEGRIYTLKVVAWDAAGNLSDPVYRTVTLPHDASGRAGSSGN